MNLTLRARLYWVLAVLMGLILGLETVAVIYHSRASVRAETLSSLALAERFLRQGAFQEEDLQALLDQLAASRHLRRPGEEVAPSAPAWFVWWVSPTDMDLTRRIGVHQVTIEADPGDEISEAWQEARLFFLFLMVLAGSSALVIHLLLGRAFRPVPSILAALEQVKQGHYHVRLNLQEPPELRCIAGAFNHMVAALEHTWAENRRLTRRLLEIQEAERRRLARDLHDEVGQSLSALKALARVAAEERMAEICDRVLLNLRDLLQRLHPAALEELGLQAALDALVEDFRQHHPHIALQWNCDPLPPLAGEKKRHLYRIAQEALHNVGRHAKARAVRMQLGCREGGLGLEISDDGQGFDPANTQRGLGLLGMVERTDEMGGTLTVTAGPGQGCRIRVWVPL